MSQYHGVVQVDVSSWQAFKNATMGNWYDVDGLYGAQCVDYFKLLNYNFGYPLPYADTGTFGTAEGLWADPVARAFNKGSTYNLITRLSDLQIGDMVILGSSTGLGSSGHNGVLDSNLIVNPPGTTGIFAYLVGQNQVDPNPVTGHEVTRTLINMSTFLGAFRAIPWNSTPPINPVNSKKFPWFMITRKKLVKNNKKRYN